MIKVKPEYADIRIGFNNSFEKLGSRDDLHILVTDAKAGNVRHILDLLESIPSDEELLKAKEEAFLNKRMKR